MIFQHKPLWNENNPQWQRIRKMLADRQKATVMAGHIHEYMATQVDGLEYVALATTGGGSPLKGKDAGELDHITWVTMKDDGPTVANLQLDGILPIGFRTNESAKRYDEVSKGKFIQIKPISVHSDTFDSVQAPLILKNPDSEPLRVKILFEPQEGVIVRPAAISTTLPPKSQVSYDLKVESEKSIPIAQLQPIGIHWQAAQDRPEKESLHLSGLNRIFIDGKRTIPKTAPKVIDGNLDDWPELTQRVEMPAEIHTNLQAWRGVDDAKYRWAVAADDKFLYFAIDVFDDQIDHQGEMLWQDFAGVFVNPVLRPDAKPEDIKKEAFAVMAGLSMSADDQKRYKFGTQPENVQSSVKQLANRIFYEFAIPTDRFNELQGGTWSKLQLNVIVNDHDTNDQREGICVMYWRPRWDGLFHYPTSGIFDRQ
ncbi:MAG: sugar-binding protein [Pirellulales bacterium]